MYIKFIDVMGMPISTAAICHVSELLALVDLGPGSVFLSLGLRISSMDGP